MEFLSTTNDNLAKEGDIVVLFSSRSEMVQAKLTANQVTQTSKGHFHHNSIIGSRYGSFVFNPTKSAFCRLFMMTPELWTETLSHRTQIMYTPDISIIISRLDVKPGDVVCEAGTGSGSLSHSLIKAVAPGGHVFTFEFHELRAAEALKEFTQNGLLPLVSSFHRDVCANGFLVENSLADHQADSLFLDVPSPWKAISHVYRVLKHNGNFCSFSPSVEQIQKTLAAMSQHGGFVLPTVIGVQCFPYDLKPVSSRKSSRMAEESLSLLSKCEEFMSILPSEEYSLHKRCAQDRYHTGYLMFCKTVLNKKE
ncbi:hypothetical protein RCL1_008382 [Eukaryota sp. TZLM3-RCL]